MSQILIIDNFDSFTYNLVHLVRELSSIQPYVVRNNAIDVAEAAQFKRIILSPGPGLPANAGIMPSVVAELCSTHTILGVCLGHQCIAETYGATLHNLTSVSHGQQLNTIRCDSRCPLLRDIPNEFLSGRYHSWVVTQASMPDQLRVTAVDDSGEVMALRHETHQVYGVQFHPESILTPLGKTILGNFLSL